MGGSPNVPQGLPASQRGPGKACGTGTGGEEEWVVDGEEWAEVFEAWLESKASGHTRKAYRRAWHLLATQTGKMPGEIRREDLLKWVETMRQEGASPKSIQLRLGAISSFYGGLKSLGIRNPAAEMNIWQRESGEGLTKEEMEAFLGAIQINTLNGKRDYALCLCFLTSGHRNSEMRLLRHKQIVREGKRTWLTWRKNGQYRREACPARLGEALERYLSECETETLDKEGYVFTAWPGGKSTGAALAITTVCRMVKKYAKKAGLKETVTVTTLRNTALREKRNEYRQ
jgi:site-specific recombinase XerD